MQETLKIWEEITVKIKWLIFAWLRNVTQWLGGKKNTSNEFWHFRKLASPQAAPATLVSPICKDFLFFVFLKAMHAIMEKENFHRFFNFPSIIKLVLLLFSSWISSAFIYTDSNGSKIGTFPLFSHKDGGLSDSHPATILN